MKRGTRNAERGTVVVWVAVALLLGGCETQPTVDPDALAVDPVEVQGYALLHDLVSRQRGVSKILILKSPSGETAAIIRDIAKTADEATGKLKAFAAARGIELSTESTGLPQFDLANRQRIESRNTKYLLFGSGESFEVKLIFTQLNACEYGLTLARELASRDVPEEHKQYLNKFADDYESIFNQLVARLGVK